MAYPVSLDELTDGVPSDGTAAATSLGDATYQHDDHHRALAVAVEAVEAELGTAPSGAAATVAARLDAADRFFVGAGAMADVSATCTAGGGGSPNAYEFWPVWKMPAAGTSQLGAAVNIPTSWASWSADVFMVRDSASGGDVVFETYYRSAVVDGSSLSGVYSAGNNATVTLAAQYTVKVWEAIPSAVTTGVHSFLLRRGGDSGADTFASDLLVLGVLFRKVT